MATTTMSSIMVKPAWCRRGVGVGCWFFIVLFSLVDAAAHLHDGEQDGDYDEAYKAAHDDDHAFGREKMAREVYDYYNSQYSDEERIELPDFKLMRYFALMDYLNDPTYPMNLRIALRNRIQLERPEFSERLSEQEEFLIQSQQQQ